MARLTYSQKTSRTLTFLEASVDPRVNPPLAAAGYTDADVEEGWTLLKQAGTARKMQQAPPRLTPRTREQLDEFENYWFPVVSASLKRRYPEVHAEVFQNLGQEEGVEVAMNVSVFLDRIKQISQRPNGQEVMALLETRGLTPAAIAEAEGLIKDFIKVQPKSDVDLGALKRAHEQAVDTMWDWYLEWSTIARTVVSNRRHLRMLGFLSPSGGSDKEEQAADTSSVSESGFPAASDTMSQGLLSA